MLHKRVNKICLSFVLLFLASTVANSQTPQGIGSIMDELDNQQTSPSSTSGQQTQLSSLCLYQFGNQKKTSRARKYCQCFSTLMVTKFKANENDYYIQMMNVATTTRDGTRARQTALVNTSIKAVESGLTEKDTKYIRREAKVIMNYAQAHVQYGDQCKYW